MLFRIEDIENPNGHLREYEIPFENLPRLNMVDLEKYLAEEIRKEINNANDRKLLSYSKSIGICLLKYNKFTDNELHITEDYIYDFVSFYTVKDNEHECTPFSLHNGLCCLPSKYKDLEIILENCRIDVSNNNLVDNFLKLMTGKGKKRVASPEKDNEVLLMQSPNDIIISEYLDSIYLLYALVIKYGMSELIYKNLSEMIRQLDEFRFEFCEEKERYALLRIIKHLYLCGGYEGKTIRSVLQDIQRYGRLSLYYDPILQLCGIQEDSFDDSYMLSDYNTNVVSDCIWCCYNNWLKNYKLHRE